MTYLMLIYAVLFPVLLGYFTINIFLQNKDDASFPERIALGFCIGLMIITAEMFFVLPKLNISYSVMSISIPLLPFIFLGLYITIKNKIFSLAVFNPISFVKEFADLSLLEKLFILLLLFRVFYVFSSEMIKPVAGVDAWGGYSMRANVYFLEKTSNVPAFPPTVRGQHNALSQTWVFTCINQWNDILSKINFPLYYIALLIIFYCAVRRFKPRSIALLSTYILGSLPFLVYHATLEYCDFMIGIYLFAGIAFMHLWFNNPHIRYLLLSLAFLFSLITIKSEGFLHLTIVFVVFALTIFSKKLDKATGINIIRNITIAGIIIGAAYMYQKIFLVPNESLLFLPSPDFSRVPALFSVFGDYIFIRDNWNIIWSLLLILLIFNFRKLKEMNSFSLLAIVVFELFGFMTYYFTQIDWVYNMLFYVTPAVRNILQFMPVTMFLIANLLTLEMPEYPLSESSLITNKSRADNK